MRRTVLISRRDDGRRQATGQISDNRPFHPPRLHLLQGVEKMPLPSSPFSASSSSPRRLLSSWAVSAAAVAKSCCCFGGTLDHLLRWLLFSSCSLWWLASFLLLRPVNVDAWSPAVVRAPPLLIAPWIRPGHGSKHPVFPSTLLFSSSTSVDRADAGGSNRSNNADAGRENYRSDNDNYDDVRDRVLRSLRRQRDESVLYADGFEPGLLAATTLDVVAAFHNLFRSIRASRVPLNFRDGTAPFVLQNEEVSVATSASWRDCFTIQHLERALEDDFLDAARGSTDNRRGWTITDVSQPRGQSFTEARMTFEDVQKALEKGTVIFNAAGAHIPRLAGPCLAACDATLLPCALNLYVTKAGMRTSAPPHTDKQDVVVVQSTGRKKWKVYSPPDPGVKPGADPFGRGKGDDSLNLYTMQDQYGCELLLEVTLEPGDALFVPAGFPHTTSTVVRSEESEALDDEGETEPSVHLTLGIDHHVWELDFLNARRLGLRRAGIRDVLVDDNKNEDDATANPFVGKVNELPRTVWKDLMSELPLGLLDDEDMAASDKLRDAAAVELQRLCSLLDPAAGGSGEQQLDLSFWTEVVDRLRQEGRELLEIHRDMYLAALEEGRQRQAEDAMTAHLRVAGQQGGSAPSSSVSASALLLSPERVQRLSLFRVKRYYDRINESKESLRRWSLERMPVEASSSAAANTEAAAPSVASEAPSSEGALTPDWAFVLPLKVGDDVEADLGGGAFFAAKVTRVSSDPLRFDVRFFDGDSESDLPRSRIRLLQPPRTSSSSEQPDPSRMTAKQLKKWKKQQEKLSKKR